MAMEEEERKKGETARETMGKEKERERWEWVVLGGEQIKRVMKTAVITLWRAHVKAEVESMIRVQDP